MIDPQFQFPHGPKKHIFATTFLDTQGWDSFPIAGGSVTPINTAVGGVVRFANASGTDNSGAQMQWPWETFGLSAGQELEFLIRMRTSEITETALFFGLGVYDATFFGGGAGTAALTASDAVGIFKPDGSSVPTILVWRDSSLVLSDSLPALVANEWTSFGYRVTMDASTAGKATVSGFSTDGASVTQTSWSVTTTFPYADEEYLTPTLAAVSGSTSNFTCDVDWVTVAQTY
jgi:hypothetical protein